MATLKYSRQRESIKTFLMTRKDHPTADTVYMNIRQEYPNISLGTVYRNLSLLSDLGEIQKLSLGDGADRFDGNAKAHYHFICRQCQCVKDLDMEQDTVFDKTASKHFQDGSIEGHMAYFYGICNECQQENN